MSLQKRNSHWNLTMTKWVKHKIYEYRKRFGKLVDFAEKTIPKATWLKKR